MACNEGTAIRSRNQIVTKVVNLFTLGTKLIVVFQSLLLNKEKQYQARCVKFDDYLGIEYFKSF